MPTSIAAGDGTVPPVSGLTIQFSDPHKQRDVERAVSCASQLPAVLRDLQRELPDLNFLVDVTAPGRERVSVVLAGEEGAAILWRDPPWRTFGSEGRTDEIYVWDGAGVEMPGKQFLPLEVLLPAIVQWFASGSLEGPVDWRPEHEVM